MLWLVAKKEFLNNIVTSGFIVGLALCLVLLPYTVYTGIQTYENRLAQYETDIKSAEEVYQKSQVYAQVNPLVVKPVSPLSIFSKASWNKPARKSNSTARKNRCFRRISYC